MRQVRRGAQSAPRRRRSGARRAALRQRSADAHLPRRARPARHGRSRRRAPEPERPAAAHRPGARLRRRGYRAGAGGAVAGARPAARLRARLAPGDRTSRAASRPATPRASPATRAWSATTAPRGGYKVERYVDKAGHECAYYDTTLLFPTQRADLSERPTGVAVLDMTDPGEPEADRRRSSRRRCRRRTSRSCSTRSAGCSPPSPATPPSTPGIVDVYDLNEDCRHPVLQVELAGRHPRPRERLRARRQHLLRDLARPGDVTAVDITNPTLPMILCGHATTTRTASRSPTTATAPTSPGSATGLIILDTSEIQARKPSPQVQEICHARPGRR